MQMVPGLAQPLGSVWAVLAVKVGCQSVMDQSVEAGWRLDRSSWTRDCWLPVLWLVPAAGCSLLLIASDMVVGTGLPYDLA